MHIKIQMFQPEVLVFCTLPAVFVPRQVICKRNVRLSKICVYVCGSEQDS